MTGKNLFTTSISYTGDKQSKNNILYAGSVYNIMYAQPPSSQNKLQGQKLACALHYQNLKDVCQWL